MNIVSMFGALPKSEAARILGRQVLRSGTSVGANYREAYRARSRPEFISKAGDCLKELGDWLELLGEANLAHPDSLAALLRETDELLAFFTAVSKSTKAHLRNPS